MSDRLGYFLVGLWYALLIGSWMYALTEYMVANLIILTLTLLFTTFTSGVVHGMGLD